MRTDVTTKLEDMEHSAEKVASTAQESARKTTSSSRPWWRSLLGEEGRGSAVPIPPTARWLGPYAASARKTPRGATLPFMRWLLESKASVLYGGNRRSICRGLH
jgi:hypothetical protein